MSNNGSIVVVEKLEGLVNIRGALGDALKQLEPGSMQSSSEIITNLIDHSLPPNRFLKTPHCLVPIDDGLESKNFITSNGALYVTECGDSVLYITDSTLHPILRRKEATEGNLNHIFRNLDDATEQLLRNGNYILTKSYDLTDVLASPTSVRINLSDIRLRGDGKETRYAEIDTAECKIVDSDGNKYGLNKTETALVYGVVGKDDFEARMATLNQKGRKSIRIHILNPDYVKEKAPNGGAIVRACSLETAPGYLSFSAAVRNINNTGNYVRGHALK